MVKKQILPQFGNGTKAANNSIMKNIIFLIIFFFSSSIFSQEFEWPDSIKRALNDFSGNIVFKKGKKTIYKSIKTKNDSALHQVGEVSQVFLAHFINHIAANHQIKTSDKVVKYLHDFPYPEITIENLLNHSSGLPSNYLKLYHRNFFINPNYAKGENIRVDNHDIYKIIVDKKPNLVFDSSTKFEFNNLNYIILAKLLERVTFTPLEDFTYKYFDHNDFTFYPRVIYQTDSFPNKVYGKASNGSLMDNMKDIGFPYNDATIGHQHMYLSSIELGLWLTFLFERFDFDYLKTKNKSWVEGFYFDTELNQLYSKGIFLAHETYCLMANSGYILVMNSSEQSDGKNEAIFKMIQHYLASLD